MIYFPEKQLVIITPPHTASQHLHEALSKVGGVWVIGNTIGGTCDHHYNRVMTPWLDKCKFHVVVRNPYDRFIGLYLHYRWVNEEKGVKPMEWPDFIMADDHPYWIFRTSIYEYMKYSNIKKYGLIRYETLKESIENMLDEYIDLKQPYHDPHTVLDWYMDNNFIELFESKYALDDCREYKYPLIRRV